MSNENAKTVNLTEAEMEAIGGGLMDSAEFSAMAQAAVEAEINAKRQDDTNSYTHVFKTPFTYEGKTYESLTFQWDSLTGADSLAIENEMLAKGKTLVLPAYTGEYLTGMAARACTDRDERGMRTVSTKTIQALPIGDFQRICGRARTFLLRSGL